MKYYLGFRIKKGLFTPTIRVTKFLFDYWTKTHEGKCWAITVGK